MRQRDAKVCADRAMQGDVRVFVAGSTGVLGRRIVAGLVTRGHEVVGLARSAENSHLITSLGAEPRQGDLFDPETLVRAARGADVIIRAATSIPRSLRLSAKDWATNDRIRRDGTRSLTECAGRIGAKLYLQEGIVWVAQPEDGSPFDEDARVRPRLWFASAAEAESIAREAGGRLGFEVATLRCGSFYCADSAQTRLLGERLVRRRLPLIGEGEAVWSNIHVDDAAAAFVTAAEAGRGGLWHVVDDHAARMADFFRTLAALLKVPPPRAVPPWVASLFIGRRTVQFLTASTRTSNAKIRRDLGWSPRYPSHQEGLRQVVDAWRSEGFPRDRRK